MSAGRTARERARAELTREIKDAARRQLAVVGAQGLSLRAVSRELGMVSSALYRYFAGRDELLTALIIDAYDAIGARVEEAIAAAGESPGARWRAAGHAVRDWARAHPHEYALVYGSPVPGYRAPGDTVAAGSRVPLALVGVVADAWRAGALTPADDVLGDELAAQAGAVTDQVAPGLPGAALTRAMTAWTQLFGMVGFELFGQLVGSMDPAESFFDYALDRMVEFLGLPAG